MMIMIMIKDGGGCGCSGAYITPLCNTKLKVRIISTFNLVWGGGGCWLLESLARPNKVLLLYMHFWLLLRSSVYYGGEVLFYGLLPLAAT